MPRYEQVQNDEVRTLLERATTELRGGNATASVHAAADAFIRLIALKPELLESNLPDPDAIHHQQFPRLGAMLASVDGRAEVRFERERFSTGDAITYLEFTTDAALREGL